MTLDPKLEKTFTDHDDQTDSSISIVAELISTAALGMKERGLPAVVLCSPKVRSSVKEATRRKIPDLAVLSYLEIPSDINVEPMGEIRLEVNAR